MAEAIFIEDARVLFELHHLHKFVWTKGMTYNERVNAMTRFALYFTLLAYLYFGSRLVVYAFIAYLGLVYYAHNKRRDQLAALIGADESIESVSEAEPTGVSEVCQTGGDAVTVVAEPADVIDVRELYRDALVDPNVVIDAVSNQMCKMSDTANPFQNTTPGTGVVATNTPICDPEAHQALINKNWAHGLYSDLNDVFDRNNSQRQFIVNPSTTIPNDRESFMKWNWDTPFVAKEDPDIGFKQGY